MSVVSILWLLHLWIHSWLHPWLHWHSWLHWHPWLHPWLHWHAWLVHTRHRLLWVTWLHSRLRICSRWVLWWISWCFVMNNLFNNFFNDNLFNNFFMFWAWAFFNMASFSTSNNDDANDKTDTAANYTNAYNSTYSTALGFINRVFIITILLVIEIVAISIIVSPSVQVWVVSYSKVKTHW